MKILALGAKCLTAALLVLPATAQVCPPGTTNPLQLLAGKTWVFHTAASDFADGGSSTIGRFFAQVPAPTAANPNPNGVLTITETIVDTEGPSVTRLAKFSGQYQINPDCSGGELMFMLGGYAIRYSFFFNSTFTEMYMVSDSLVPTHPTSTEYGTAKLSTAPACPAGITNPLSFLSGTWTFHLRSPFWFVVAPLAGTSDIGFFQASVGADKGGNPIGVLGITETIATGNGNVTRLAHVPGTYQVYPDCSGGVLYFNLGGQQNQLEYVFVDPNDMFLLTTSWVNGQIVAGEAKGAAGTRVF